MPVSPSGLEFNVACHQGTLEQHQHQQLAFSDNVEAWLHRTDCPTGVLRDVVARHLHILVRAQAACHPNTAPADAAHCRAADGWWGTLAWAFHPDTCDREAAAAVAGIGHRHHEKIGRVIVAASDAAVAEKTETVRALVGNVTRHVARNPKVSFAELSNHGIPYELLRVVAHRATRPSTYRDLLIDCLAAFDDIPFVVDFDGRTVESFLDEHLSVIREHAVMNREPRREQDHEIWVHELYRWRDLHGYAADYLGHISLYGTETEQLLFRVGATHGVAPVDAARAVLMLTGDEHLAALVDTIDSYSGPPPNPLFEQPF